MEEEWMSAYMRKHTSNRHIFALASSTSSANCQNIHHLFIFIHCTVHTIHAHSFILPFSPFSPPILLLMIRFHHGCYYYYLFLHYHLLSESQNQQWSMRFCVQSVNCVHVSNDTTQAKCFSMAGWLAGCLKDDGLNTQTHTYVERGAKEATKQIKIYKQHYTSCALAKHDKCLRFSASKREKQINTTIPFSATSFKSSYLFLFCSSQNDWRGENWFLELTSAKI